MRPIPVAFHLGPLQIHTYGIGLAITFWFAYRYFERRLRDNGYPYQWLGGVFVWVIVAAIVGARVVHVASHASYYWHDPAQILQVWNGGLSSFGGLLFAVPTGLLLARRRCPELSAGRAMDLIAPVLVAAWAVGRLLGPQLMVAGGGKPTTAWYGMYYADQVGKRVPAPIFQSLECFAIFGVLLWVERRYRDRPTGFMIALAAVLWGLDRFFDEYLWLAVPRVWDSVEVVSLVMAAAGLVALAVLVLRQRRSAEEVAGGPDGALAAATPASPSGAEGAPATT